MEPSGLIFVALALVWAVVLIPKALRHDDEVAKTRSVDQVSDAARVLARREAVTDREARLVVPPPRPVEPKPQPSLDTRRVAAAAAARRRRHVLLLLLVADLCVGAAAAIGLLLPWTPAIPVALTLGFLALSRFLVTREHARWDRAVAARRASQHPVVAAALEDGPVEDGPVEVGNLPEPTPREQLSDRGVPVVSGLEETSSLPLAQLDGLELSSGSGSLWDPLPVTLPTYVSKPRATRSVRTIDLADPGVSSSGRDAADSALVAEAATAGAASEGADQRAVGS